MFVCVCMYVHTYACMHLCMYVSRQINAWIHACAHVFMYVSYNIDTDILNTKLKMRALSLSKKILNTKAHIHTIHIFDKLIFLKCNPWRNSYLNYANIPDSAAQKS